MMPYTYFSTQESGPDEDHFIRPLKLHKVLVDEDHSADFQRGIYTVEKSDLRIEEFIDSIPSLVRQDGTFGLIWNKSLHPSDGRYEPGEHYCSTRELERKSANGSVSFYRDGDTGKKFAIKVLKDSDHYHAWEIKIGLVCDSPNLCAVYGVIVRNHKVHILLEHAGSELIKERAWIAQSSDNILSFAKQSFRALQDLHRCGYVHCDIKPDNIMIVKDDLNKFTVKVVDFGSCQPIGGVLPPNAHTTRYYWSPEIWKTLCNGDQVICQPAMDVYALALTLFFIQTSVHLMNMLQEKDILPLMTQRPDDVLLIGLPESIPSGLRAVMRPCLNGSADDRWSAQQAASQLDGDAMIQRALSNPQTGNYKDLFNQLKQNRFEKALLQVPPLCLNSLTKGAHMATGSESSTLNIAPQTQLVSKESMGVKCSPVHVFVGSSRNTDKTHAASNKTHAAFDSGKNMEKRDMGFQVKIQRGAVERKHNTQVNNKVKRSGSLKTSFKSNVFTRPRKSLTKNASPINTNCQNVDFIEQDNYEVHVISSDEDEPVPQYRSNHSSSSQTVSAHETVNASKTSIDDQVPKSVIEVWGDSWTETHTNYSNGNTLKGGCVNKTHNSQDPQKQMFMRAPVDQSQTIFSCSALLTTLATQAQSVHNNSKPLFKGKGNNHGPGYVIERDKHQKLHLPRLAEKEKCERVYNEIDSSPFKSKISENFQNLKLTQGLRYLPTGSDKLNSLSGSFSYSGMLVHSQNNRLPNRNNPNQTCGATSVQDDDSDMDLVLQAIDVPRYTGQAEDILDNLCSMLDKQEHTPFNADNPTSSTTTQSTTSDQLQGERMDIDTNKPCVGSNRSLSAQPRRGQKRMSELHENSIPAKVRPKPACNDTQATQSLLPNFKEILPGDME